MRRNLRWAAAGLVTIAVFATCTWLCGAVLLPSALADPTIRWSVSTTAGVVLATLAVAWGQNFAARTGPGTTVTASGDRSIAVHGNPAGDMSTGDTGDTGAHRPAQGSPARPEPAAPATPAPPRPEPRPGSTTASGNRSIAVNGNPGGTLSTGDQPGRAPS
ncbi:hypothetical protein ACFQ8C_06755 [Streptomyces sp. NPDC056503]|uniref:hypothetical protein n=1 Tax=Streptomyces sp. NPDC056503 TaxID=3345842 RepID=UPI0036BC68A7